MGAFAGQGIVTITKPGGLAVFRSFRPRLEALEGRALLSGLPPTLIEAPVMVTNTRVLADQAQLTPHDIKADLEKAIGSAPPPAATSPFANVPAGSIRSLEFEAGKGFVATTAPAPVQRVEDDDLTQVKRVSEALLAQAQSYGQAAWRWLVLKAAGDMVAANPNLPLLKWVGAE
jgi:hypothetical protein